MSVPDLPLVTDASPFDRTGAMPGGKYGRLLTNSVAMGVANLVSRGIGYGYIILMARRLDARFIGAYAIAVTTSLMVDLVANLGLDKILIREISSTTVASGKGYFLAALPIRLTAALVSASIAWLLLIVFFGNLLLSGPLSLALFLSAIFPVVAARNCEAFLTAHELLVPIAVSQLADKLVTFGSVLLLFTGTISFGGLLRFAPVAALVRLSIVAWPTFRLWERGTASSHPDSRDLIRQAVELFSVEILALVYFRSDVFLLAKMDGLRQTGIYQIAYKIFDCCLSLFSGFLQAAFPRLVRDKSQRTLKAMLAGGTALLAIPVGIVIVGRHLILGALGPQYLTGAVSLVWLMLTVPLVYITSTLANAAIAAGKIKILIVLAGLLLSTNVGLNLLLIPRWSINGAAFSTFACELLSAAVLGPFLLRSLAASRRNNRMVPGEA